MDIDSIAVVDEVCVLSDGFIYAFQARGEAFALCFVIRLPCLYEFTAMVGRHR